MTHLILDLILSIDLQLLRATDFVNAAAHSKKSSKCLLVQVSIEKGINYLGLRLNYRTGVVGNEWYGYSTHNKFFYYGFE